MAPMIYTLYGFAIFFFVFWCSMWILHLIAIFYGKYRLHNKVAKLASDVPYPGVSILKPLMGLDPNLFSNLETFFTINYPKYELLFCVEDESDPAIMLVNSLIEKYPKVDARLFIGGSDVGVNPKINNMHKAYEAASYEFVLISDSGIRMKEDTLLDMVNHMTEKTALVHQMPFTSDRNGFAATLEKIYFGTAQSRMYLGADFFRINCHTGMSALIRKSVLDEQGGLSTFGCYLAEDFFIAKSFLDRGWKMAISSQPAQQNSGICDVTSFQARLTSFASAVPRAPPSDLPKSAPMDLGKCLPILENRNRPWLYCLLWAKLRVAMLPLVIIFEPLSECMVIGACAAWAVNVLFQWDVLGFYLIHILVWFLLDWILLSIVQNGSLPFNKFDFVVGWLFRECSGPYLFLHAILDPSIKWRSRVFRLAWGGVAQEIKPRAKF